LETATNKGNNEFSRLARFVFSKFVVVICKDKNHIIEPRPIAQLSGLVFVVGYLLGGPGKDTKAVLGLGTGQRNIAAAIVVAAQNFSDPDVLITIIVIAILTLFILMPLGGKMSKRKITTT
jgi:predicted Na+-dependent transporter